MPGPFAFPWCYFLFFLSFLFFSQSFPSRPAIEGFLRALNRRAAKNQNPKRTERNPASLVNPVDLVNLVLLPAAVLRRAGRHPAGLRLAGDFILVVERAGV